MAELLKFLKYKNWMGKILYNELATNTHQEVWLSMGHAHRGGGGGGRGIPKSGQCQHWPSHLAQW